MSASMTRNSKLETRKLYLRSGELSDLVAEIVIAFSETLAHFVTREPAHANLLAGIRDLLGQQLADSCFRRFDKRLVKQNELFEELIQATFDNSVDHLI